MKNIADSLVSIRQKILMIEQKYHRTAGSVRLLAVSKTKSADDIQTAKSAGQIEFGENYVQEAICKITEINDPQISWHFIGPVQSNKTRAISEHFQWVHSINRTKIAQRLNDCRPEHLPPLNICLQVNISNEDTKSGVNLSELIKLAHFCSEMPRLRLCGLMALPALCENFKQQRIPFRQLREMLIQLQSTFPLLDTLSMGTTHDMEAAIAEGATMVRIGTAIFGKRVT
jgi:pyridoxal phosphate enzyme (YggS family)